MVRNSPLVSKQRESEPDISNGNKPTHEQFQNEETISTTQYQMHSLTPNGARDEESSSESHPGMMENAQEVSIDADEYEASETKRHGETVEKVQEEKPSIPEVEEAPTVEKEDVHLKIQDQVESNDSIVEIVNSPPAAAFVDVEDETPIVNEATEEEKMTEQSEPVHTTESSEEETVVVEEPPSPVEEMEYADYTRNSVEEAHDSSPLEHVEIPMNLQQEDTDDDESSEASLDQVSEENEGDIPPASPVNDDTSSAPTTSVANDELEENPFLVKEHLRLKEHQDAIWNIRTVRNFTFHDLGTNKSPEQILCPIFSVSKFNSKKQVFSKKTRLWEVDMIECELRNMDTKRKVKKAHPVDNVLMVEKFPKNPCKLRLTLSSANHPYDLVFKNTVEREHFFQCVCALRTNSLVWAPDFFRIPASNSPETPSEDDNLKNVMLAQISGNYNQKPYKVYNQTMDGERNGTVNLYAASKMEYPIQIFTGTWNMGVAPAPQENEIMADWLSPGKDIYAISLQESDTKTDMGAMTQFFKRILGPEYFPVGTSSLWGIRLFVFAKDKHVSKITCVQVKQKPTGFLQICGNKGGIGLSFKFHETTICIIASHLAAREEKFDKRNEDIYGISGDLNLGIKDLDVTQFNHIFWCGDLNYRLDLPYHEAVSIAQKGKFGELLETDQLAKQIKAGQIFNNWREGKITFPPTYKYKVGTNEYAEYKFRPPSYCDRILWLSQPGCKSRLLEYTNATKVLTSDHVPVRAIFSVDTQLPFVDHFSQASKEKRIVLSSLYLSGRSGAVLRKPQLYFYSNIFAANPVSTKTKSIKVKLVNPAFPDDTVPVLAPHTHHLEYLRSQRIIILLRDAGGKKKKSDYDEDFVGQCVVALNEASGDAPFKFKVPVSAYTRRVGYLNGQIHIVDK